MSPPALPPPPDAIAARLEPDENVLWLGRPAPHVFMLRGSMSAMYGACWAILGSFWYKGSGGVGHNTVFTGWWSVLPLVTVPFILAGLSFFLYPMRLGARARRTWYAVTDRRAFIVEIRKGRPAQVRLFAPAELGAPELRSRFDGLDDLLLTRRALEHPHLTPRLEDGFFGVRNGAGAVKALQTAGLVRAEAAPA